MLAQDSAVRVPGRRALRPKAALVFIGLMALLLSAAAILIHMPKPETGSLATVSFPISGADGTEPRIYSDTAVVKTGFFAYADCSDHIRHKLEGLSRSLPLDFRGRPNGVYVAGFHGDNDNYVLRCFSASNAGHTIFIAGSSVDPTRLSEGMQQVFRHFND